MTKWALVSSCLGIKQSFACARIFRDVGRVEQTGTDRDPLSAGRKNFAQIVDLDSADEKSRDVDLVVNAFDSVQSNGLIVRLGRRRENRTKANIVRAFPLRRDRLLQTVGRFSN